MNSIANYPPGVDVTHPVFGEPDEGPVAECGDCRAVCYDRNLQACGCGCQVLTCERCLTPVNGERWRTGCARDHAEQLAAEVRG